ncbi:hypothetical protein KFK09_015788 [Dendrobium nobile]|uniref:J domain-containing protein n=1 Tax=Dendrobium nobile TaxID=94219 RepID=A0A8T3B794_DENNO|nr:hypothetical protein KFK09_015788 [Dendrobium nobile]
MQTCSLIRRGSSDGGGALSLSFLLLPLPARRPLYLSWIGFGRDRLGGGAGRVAAAASAANGGADQDHYAVLGIRRNATAAEVKRAYRLLAREHHPDVSRDQQASEIFKKIRLAYEVLSDEVERARYNLTYEFPGVTDQSRRTWTLHPNYDKRRIYKWEELRKHKQNKRQKKNETSWSYQTEAYQETSSYEREPFAEVLQFAFFVLFFMQTVGCRASLTLCGISALLDKQLDAGYKMGYVVAWLLGGRAGILLTLCIYFASWLCGKSSSSIVALVVMAMWVGANITRFAPIPQGAVLTLLYMSMKLQVDSKQTR